MAGVRLWKFALVIGSGMAALPVLWHFMHDYQKKRVITFLHPEKDPLGAGYNILQSKIAIGSGGFAGKGLLHGSQSQLNFLPEHQTDFIFTMLAEELGFAGGSLILVLYTLIISYGILIALGSNNQFGRLLAIGAITIFFVHVFVNMGMVMGIMPVVGAPLPLLSYGGTIMMTILIGFGVIINVHINKEAVITRKASFRQ
jgi:rod shape determining protein RodA